MRAPWIRDVALRVEHGMDALDRSSPPFRGSDAVRARRTTPDRLRGPTFRRLGAGLYAGADVDTTEVRVRMEVLELWSRERGVVAGPLAALAHAVDCPWDDAEIVLPRRPGTPPPGGARVRTDRLDPHEVQRVGGILLTTPARTAFDLACRAPLVEAVAAVDALGHRHAVGAAAIRRLAHDHPGARGLVQVQRVADLLDRAAESLMESRTRVGLVLRGVPAPVSQHDLVLPGHGRVRLDLAWPRVRLALEYDGGEHRTIRGQNRDNRRDAALRRAGWLVIHVSSQQILDADLLDQLATEVAGLVAR